MTGAKRRVALVASPGDTRDALAKYLEDAGFDVYPCDQLAVASAFTALVLISGHDASGEALRAEVRSWIKLTRSQRLIVVTSTPTALTDLLASHGERLYVLAAPAFGWHVVDALRAREPTRPRGA
ncbi:MAG TPA: hypothetical protein VFT22_26160 [Kofleriaceae bacterium]|nr:hypothetical protein [Kofleriaceae bacterium]